MSILNLTQHRATPEQVAAGVVDPNAEEREVIRGLLTFDAPPTLSNLRTRAGTLAQYAASARSGCRSAMIGGAPFFMSSLERALWGHGIRPLYAFSRRESVEEPQPDGTVRKVAVFRHVGFVGLEAAEVGSGGEGSARTLYERAVTADAEARRAAYAFAAGLGSGGLSREVTYRNHVTGRRVATVRPDGHVVQHGSRLEPTEDGGYRVLEGAGEEPS